jgi:hypothetical protein
MPVISTQTHIRNDNEFAYPDAVRYEVDENGILIQLSTGATGGQHMKFFYDVPGLQTAHQQLRFGNAQAAANVPANTDTGAQAAQTVMPPPARIAPVTPAVPWNIDTGEGVSNAPRRAPPIQRGPSVAAGIQPMNLNAPCSTGSIWSSFMPTQATPTAAPRNTNGAQGAEPLALECQDDPMDGAPTEIDDSLEYVTVISAMPEETETQRNWQREKSPAPTIVITENNAPQEFERADNTFMPPKGIYSHGDRADAVRQWVESDAGKFFTQKRPDMPVPNILALASRELGVVDPSDPSTFSALTEIETECGNTYQAGHTPGPEYSSTGREMFVQGCSRDATYRYLREGSCKENVNPEQFEMEIETAPGTPAKQEVTEMEVTILTRSKARARGIRL